MKTSMKENYRTSTTTEKDMLVQVFQRWQVGRGQSIIHSYHLLISLEPETFLSSVADAVVIF